MPAYNEVEGIGIFLQELHDALSKWSTSFIVVDDCSTDGTQGAVLECQANGIPVALEPNEENAGHGPSTLRALKFGAARNADIVVAIDGDGQFFGKDVAVLVTELESKDLDVVEGVRISREDPLYRKVTSFVTRTLVASRAKERPRDANTPLRVYRNSFLTQMLTSVPQNAMTPNLHISVICRTDQARLEEISVRSRGRLGSSVIGSSWGRGSLLPSKRFRKFCSQALKEWIQAGR